MTVLKPGEARLFLGSIAVILLSLASLGVWYFLTQRVEIAAVGGEYTEALVGEPQLINPLYASSNDADADLSSLIYSGLLRWDENQELVYDLAEYINISEDGLTYTIQLRDDAKFHNGEELRARDVIFTINAIQNPAYRSPLAVSFRGVTATQVDEKTVAFTLDEPFAPFLTTLTVGILPANSWASIAPKNALIASLNLEPIGSGPYRFAEFSKDKSGNILSYVLKRNTDYYGEGPLIDRLTFKFYPDSDAALRALENRNVEGVSFVPAEIEPEIAKNRTVTILHPSLPRETVLFFNQSAQPILAKDNVRLAIAHALNKEALVQEVLNGNGTVISGPILPGMIGYDPEIATQQLDRVKAADLLDEEGYELEDGNTYRTDPDAPETDAPEGEEGADPGESPSALTLTITTVQNAEFIHAAEVIAKQLATVGIRVVITPVAPEAFFESVIAPRDFEMLLTGVLLGTDSDPFPFWHSSQAGEGGLNIASFTNRNIDTLLETARATIDEEERATLYREFQETLAEEVPAVFLYQSTYAYAISNKIHNVSIERIANPAGRFAGIRSWYIKTKKSFK